MNNHEKKDELLSRFEFSAPNSALDARILSSAKKIHDMNGGFVPMKNLRFLPWAASAAAALLLFVGFRTKEESKPDAPAKAELWEYSGMDLAVYQYIGMKDGKGLLRLPDGNQAENIVKESQHISGFVVREILPDRITFENNNAQTLYLYRQSSVE